MSLKIKDSVEAGKMYLLSQITSGLCFEFYQLRHGPSYAWTTACVGSTLSEFSAVPKKLLEAILSLQNSDGGWSYNPSVPSDADSTLRVIQFLRKINFKDLVILSRAEKFVLSLQQDDGGFTTYQPKVVKSMGYEQNGWSISHPCVTALAINQLSNNTALKKARNYLKHHIKNFGPISYWWRSPFYILYEMGYKTSTELIERDAVEISLKLLLETKFHIVDDVLSKILRSLQNKNGSFSPSKQFRIPRPYQTLNDLTGKEEVVTDQHGIFSTCAAIIALSRQNKL